MVGVNLDYYVEAAISYLEENGYTDVITLWQSYDAGDGYRRSVRNPRGSIRDIDRSTGSYSLFCRC